MTQPEGFVDSSNPHHVCRLHKSLYGLKQAPRSWFHKLKTALLSWGFTNSTSDTSLFLKVTDTTSLFLLVYVDDILVTGSSPADIKQLIITLHSTFALKTLGTVNYFLGFEAFRDSSGLFLTQAKYIADLLKKTNMADSHSCDTPIAAGTKLSLSDGVPFSDPTLYRSTIDALQYLTNTRPDISFIINKLSQFLVAPTLVH